MDINGALEDAIPLEMCYVLRSQNLMLRLEQHRSTLSNQHLPTVCRQGS